MDPGAEPRRINGGRHATTARIPRWRRGHRERGRLDPRVWARRGAGPRATHCRPRHCADRDGERSVHRCHCAGPPNGVVRAAKCPRGVPHSSAITMRNAIRRNRFTLSIIAGVVSCLTTTSTVIGQGGGPLPYRPGIDVTDYAITLDLPESGTSIAGRAVLTVRRWGAVDTLALDLVALKVDSVLVDEKPVTFARTDSLVRIPIGHVVGDSFSVTVRYAGEPKDGLIIQTDSSGRWTAFGDNWPNRARNWIPSIDHPSDKATVTWTVRAPSVRRVVANGELMEETPLAGPPGSIPRTLTRWREFRPISPYLMVIAAAPLVYYDLGRDGCGVGEFSSCVRQSVYVFPESRDFLPGPFAHSPEMVRLFSELIAPFPYEKLAHLESSTRYGGMENAGAIFYADAPFRRRTMQPGVIAHETAHQWFGDAVTEREWSHVWLSEGFATYFEALWVERFAGDSGFRDEMRRIREEIFKAPEVASRPVIDTLQTDLM